MNLTAPQQQAALYSAPPDPKRPYRHLPENRLYSMADAAQDLMTVAGRSGDAGGYLAAEQLWHEVWDEIDLRWDAKPVAKRKLVR